MKRRGLMVAAVTLLVAALILWFRKETGTGGPRPTADIPLDAPSPSGSSHMKPGGGTPGNPMAEEPAEADSPSSPATIANAAKRIQTALEKFRETRDEAEAFSLLTRLREDLRALPDDAVAAAIVAFLKTGDDAAIPLPFTVGADGMMDTVPTLRLALLDLLPSLDPLAALEVARELMKARGSPDEYALSLRNLAWNDLEGDMREELAARFLDLLETPWMNSPSSGVLESFDIAVELGGEAIFDRLVQVAKGSTTPSGAALSQAAYIALDRIVLRDPSILASAVGAETGWMSFAPLQRASLMSRLDISNAGQRDLFLHYLTAMPHGAGELDYFAEIFPNGNFLHGHRFVTTDEPTPTLEEVAAADQRVVEALETMALPDETEALQVISKVKNRLAGTKKKE